MEALATPVSVRGRRSKATPLSKRTPLSTPGSALTPNDDAAEKAAARKHRAAERMRKSLAGSFAGAAAPKNILPDKELQMMLDAALKMAAENKITDRNVWSLALIDHLPDLVAKEAPTTDDGANGGGGGTNYFTRISGGLDAGVQIYAKRVEAAWKQAFQQLNNLPEVEGQGGQDGDGSQDPAAGGAERKRRRRGGAEPQETDTLADADAVRAKPGDGSFMVDPLFHRMSQIFDEDGAAGMLMLNRGVFDGSAIMFESDCVPEDAFPMPPLGPAAVAAARNSDVAVNMTLLQPLIQGLVQQQRAAPPDAAPGACGAIAPSMRDLYALVATAAPDVPMARADEGAVEAEVAEIMQAVEDDCVRFPVARAPPLRPRRAPAADGDASMADTPSLDAAGSCAFDGMDAAAEGPDADGGVDSSGAFGLADGCGNESVQPEEAAAAAAESQRRQLEQEAEVAARLAEQYAPQPDDMEAGDYGDDGGWDAGGDDGASSDGEGGETGAGPSGARQSGAGGEEETAYSSLLGPDALEGGVDAECLSQLLGLGGSGVTRGAGWAGSGYWRFQRRPDAPGRRGAADKDKLAKRGRKAADTFVDFEAPPPLPADALAPGTAKQTTLATLTAAATLLPEDLRYEAAALGRLFLKPTAVLAAAAAAAGLARGSGEGGVAAAAAARRRSEGAGHQQVRLVDWAADLEEGAAGAAGWGGNDGDDDDDGGADAFDFGGGYDSDGEAAAGAPGGGSGAAAGGGGASVDAAGGDLGLDLDPEHELLQAPRRVAAVGVSYSRASKQVDVHALKEIIWGGVLAANDDGAGANAKAREDAAAPVDFRDVIKVVPRQSAAGRLEDMSVHMCFICLLHLANQHGLEVKGAADLRTLTVRGVPAAGAAAQAKGA